MLKFGDHATNIPSNIRFATNGVFNESIQYRYDSMGNIVEVFENGRSVCRYEYDALGRITREDNVAFAKTTTWTYDNNGNILAKYEYDITAKPTSELHLLSCTCKLYAYADNSDRLMSYNGEAFVYDLIGNPTTYRGKSAAWSYGRELTTFDVNTFSYDARGRRTAKNNITFIYDSNGNLVKQSNGLEFFYDHSGVFAVKYNNSTYFYRKNAQNDIIAILDTNGNTVVKYKYDAWGKCVVDSSTTNTELANLNPFRYRSYYYDTETDFYFLKTRYYDPEIRRFITIDDISYLDPDSINGLNLYAYCLNNPTKYADHSGHSVTLTILAIIGISAVIGAISGAVISGATYAMETDNFVAQEFWASVAGGAVSGGITGLVSGITLLTGGTAGVLFGVSIGAGVLAGFFGQLTENAVNGYTGADLMKNVVSSAVWGGVFGAIFGATQSASLGVKRIAEIKGRTISKQLSSILKHRVIKKSGINSIENILSDFTSWYSEKASGKYYNNVRAMVQ